MEIRNITVKPEDHTNYQSFVEGVKRGEYDDIRFSHDCPLARGYTHWMHATVMTDRLKREKWGTRTTLRVKGDNQGGEVVLVDFTLDDVKKARDIIARESGIDLGGDEVLENQVEVIRMA